MKLKVGDIIELSCGCIFQIMSFTKENEWIVEGILLKSCNQEGTIGVTGYRFNLNYLIEVIREVRE